MRPFWRRARTPVGVWHHEAYRIPLSGAETSSGVPVRRADEVLWFLSARRWVRPEQVSAPEPVSYEALARVHTREYLDSVAQPEVLGRIFGADPGEVEPDELLKTARIACGGTVAAAHTALQSRRPQLNLLGGFHHAAPARGGGFCVFNDVAVALAAVRAEGFTGQAVVLDLDAHPPDGLAECMREDARCWVGSVSGSDWGAVPGVTERLLPPGTGDGGYLDALEALLAEMPAAELAFVIAGGDVLAGDRLGRLALTLDGARRRDLRTHEALRGVPAVWLPGGGYGEQAWRALGGTAMALLGLGRKRIPASFDPVSRRFASVARQLTPEALGQDWTLTDEDLGLGPRARPSRLLGYYSLEGIEWALERYGLLPALRRLGYGALRLAVDPLDDAERVRLFGAYQGVESVLIEVVLERRPLTGGSFLFVDWLTLRNPRAVFSPSRPPLPGQEVPGLGLAREVMEVLAQMARRLSLDGVAFCPAWFHTAYAARPRAYFFHPERQGRFEALVRDLSHLPLRDATVAVAEGRVRLNGAAYAWEAEPMGLWLDGRQPDSLRVAQVRDAAQFEVLPPVV